MRGRRIGAWSTAAVALLLAAAASGAAASEVSAAEADLTPYAGYIPVDTAEQAAFARMMRDGFLSVAKEIVTGEEDPIVFSAALPNVTGVNASHIQAQIFAAAVTTWKTSSWDAPSNRGLKASKFLFYDRYHYYQIPKGPVVGTLVMFHGCYHDASGSWPWHPTECPECLGLPEEVAHVKLALKYGFAVLAVESRNRSQHGRCFSSSPDPATSDMWQAPYVIQNFLYEKGLQALPVYTLGISAGAGFATKLPKAFYESNFGGVIKLGGIISEVNAPSTWRSWGLLHRNGSLRYPDFPPVAFIMMERDNNGPGSTNQLILDRIADLRNVSIPADFLMVKPRRIGKFFFSERAPTITAEQSSLIVQAMQKLGFIDLQGNLLGDPRVGDVVKGSPLFRWNERLVGKLQWLHNDIRKLSDPKWGPMLSVLSDRSAIFQEMNVAYAMHEGSADHLVPCLFWLRSRGKLDLRWLSSKLSVTRLRDITMTRVYPKPFPPMPPPAPPSPPPPPPKAVVVPINTPVVVPVNRPVVVPVKRPVVVPAKKTVPAGPAAQPVMLG